MRTSMKSRYDAPTDINAPYNDTLYRDSSTPYRNLNAPRSGLNMPGTSVTPPQTRKYVSQIDKKEPRTGIIASQLSRSSQQLHFK